MTPTRRVAVAVSGFALVCGAASGCSTHLESGTKAPIGLKSYSSASSRGEVSAPPAADAPAITPSTVPRAPFCSFLDVHQAELRQFPGTAADAQRAGDVWALARAQAPTALQPAVSTLADTVAAVARGQGASVDSTRVEAESQVITRWFATHCGAG